MPGGYWSTIAWGAYFALPENVGRPLSLRLRRDAFRRLERLRVDSSRAYSFAPFDELGCAFVHIPKTGGVSVSTALFGWNAGGHQTLAEYAWIYGRAELARRFTFTFVRNPWDRLYSAWRYLRAGGIERGDRAFGERHLSGYRDFDDWVCRWLTRDSALACVHFRPQYRFLRLARDRPEVDFVGRFEYLAHDFGRLCRIFGVARELLHLNRTPGPSSDYRAAYSRASRAIVADVYAKDADWFGYTF